MTESRERAGFHRSWRRLRVAFVACLLAISCTLLPNSLSSSKLRYELVMIRVDMRMDRGDMEWVNDCEDWLAYLRRTTSDHVWLSDRLLEERSACLVYEGLILSYKAGHPHLRDILERHLTDDRVNWNMAQNSCVARQLLDLLDGRPERVEFWILDRVRR